MKCVIDIECNALENPTQIWVVVCKDIDTGERYVFRNLLSSDGVPEPDSKKPSKRETTGEGRRFLQFSRQVVLWIGHNIVGYDLPVLDTLIGSGFCGSLERVVDTLVISRLINYSRVGGHSIEQYGKEFGIEKGKFSDWSKYSQEMEDYCVRDVDITEQIYRRYSREIHSSSWRSAIDCEQRFQLIVNDLRSRGYCFNSKSATSLLEKVTKDLKVLDDDILKAFPPREVLVREFTPKLTKHGTISRTSVPRSLWGNILDYEAGKVYRQTKLVEFNPASHKQVIQVLNEAGWQPIDKTASHIEASRVGEIPERFQIFGWKVNETNLATLPDTAPKPARVLAKRILLESRRRTLVEWLGLVQDDGRIHGRFQGIGAWTHRMAHQEPNTANIPVAFKQDGTPKLLGKEMRSLWRAPRNRLLVGVDAEGIQLRIFAHYINDEEFTDALVRGRKEDKTDPHNLNQRILGDVCKSRDAAKRFIFAYLLGGGVGKLATILDCSKSEGQRALDRLTERYVGLQFLKEKVIPKDARQGFFVGLDGREVLIPDETLSGRRHLCMSGYLQNGEAIVIKRTALGSASLFKPDTFFVDIVHDEFVIEAPNDIQRCDEIKEIVCTQIEKVGRDLKLRCPLKGDGGIGLNWLEIH